MRADTGSILRQCFLINRDPYRTILRREFHCIAQQINQHLVQPHAVTAHIFRKNLIRRRVKILVFRFHLRLYNIDNTIHHIPQGHRFNIQRHLAAFDFGNVQHVINQPQQMLAGYRNFAQVFLHPVRVIGIGHCQRRHAYNGVHRRTDVVAHAGKKVLLCSIGVFRIFASLFRCLPRYIHFLIHALQLLYLLSKHSEILIKYTEEHGDYGKG